MQLGNEFGQQHCARCNSILTIPAHFQDGEWYHQKCWHQGAHQLADATRVSEQVRRMHDLFPPIVFLPKPETL
jgi:hypothetical protein